jgi:hypothetical protein
MLVGVSIASYRAWVGDHVEEPKKRHLAIDALDAFERLQSAKSVSAQQLVPIVDAAQCQFVRIWEIGTHLLCTLAENHAEAQGAIRAMLVSKHARVRYQSIALLRLTSVPRSFAVDLLRLALRDKSWQVRGKASESAGWLGVKELLPDLQEALRVEKHAICRECLNFDFTMLRDGYLLCQPEGVLYVNLNRDGYYWRSVPVTVEELATRGLKPVIAEARSLPY